MFVLPTFLITSSKLCQTLFEQLYDLLRRRSQLKHIAPGTHLRHLVRTYCELAGMTRMSRRGPWLPEEDSALIDLVRTQGPNNWVRISQQLQHRSPKQCRERYHQNLKPSLNHEPISPAEGEMIEQLVHEMGKRWAEIARRLGNRSDNAVKNWWNGSMNRRKRNPMQHNSIKHIGNRLHPIPNTKAPKSNCEHHAGAQILYQNHYATATRADNNLSIQDKTHADVRMLHTPTLRLESDLLRSSSYQHISLSHRSPSYPASFAQHASPDHSPFPHDKNSKLPLLRLPALSSYQPEGPLPPGNEKPSISPCVSEFSYASSTKAVPSLVSDNHSTHSISPKTFGSPPITGKLETQSYNNSNGHATDCSYRNPRSMTTQSYWHHHDTISLSGSTKISHVSNIAFPLADCPLNYRGNVYDPVSTARTDSLKDSRMNVSSLVQ